MPTPNKTTNPLFARLKSDNIFGGGAQDNLRASMDSTYANLRGGSGPQTNFGEQNAMASAGIYEPDSFGAQNAAANGTGIAGTREQFQAAQAAGLFSGGMGNPAAAAPGSAPINSPSSPLNVATGNIFGGGIPTGERAAAVGSTVPQQVAGVVSGLDDVSKVNAFQQRLTDAGINGKNMAENRAVVQSIYNNVFGGGLPAGAPSSSSGLPSGVPVSAIAPTGLRDRAMAAGNQGTWGQGDVMAWARPQANGGTHFDLGQVRPVGGPNAVPMAPANPIAPSSPQNGLSRLPQGPSAYQQNAQAFKDNLVAQQMTAGLMKALPPGYMLDPNKPNAIMPIPGGPAEAKVAEDATKRAEAAATIQEDARQSVEKANLVTRTVNQILPQLNSMTTGVGAALTESIPGFPAYTVGKLKDTVTANIGLKELKSMREASKTGASGMGALSEKELGVLETSLGNLKLAQDKTQVEKAMKDVRNSFYRWRATYKAGLMNNDAAAQKRVAAVDWALKNEKDPRAEKILSMDEQ